MFFDVNALGPIERGHRLVELVEIGEIKIIALVESPYRMFKVTLKPLVVGVKKGYVIRIAANMI